MRMLRFAFVLVFFVFVFACLFCLVLGPLAYGLFLQVSQAVRDCDCLSIACVSRAALGLWAGPSSTRYQ